MQNQNLPTSDSNTPTHLDDYQPPQVGQPFSAPSAPTTTDSNPYAGNSQSSSSNMSDLDDIIEESKLALNSFDDDQQQDEQVQEDQSSLRQDSQGYQGDGDDSSSDSPLTDQSLETQNIFDLLGVSDGKDEEKEAFLDELQEVIWEDFIENDVGLLLSEEQISKFNEIKSKGQSGEVQEEMLVYLEEIIPDLEDIMMDKALELKEDMVLERISGMKEFFSGNQAALDQIQKAEDLISQNKWSDAGSVLNSVK